MDLPAEIVELLQGRNFAHLASLLPDGSPHSVPVWVGFEDGRIAFFTGADTRKARNLERDGRVALSITDDRNPYRSAWVRGEIVERFTGDRANAIVDRISQRYTGQPFPMRDRLVLLIEPERAGTMNLPFAHERTS
ncbi:MAG: PPOX class F420-dependent oxidoreductase [Gaiellaceae bacterium]